MITTNGITIVESGVTRIADATFRIGGGECVGISGPEKTGGRLLRILATLATPTSGSIDIEGANGRPATARHRIGYVSADAISADRLHAEEYLLTVAGARGVDARGQLRGVLASVGLRATAAVDALSSRQRTALALACAMLIRPAILLLDDPLSGMDETPRRQAMEWIIDARNRGAAVALASNDEAMLAVLCQRVVRLHAGQSGSNASVEHERCAG